MDEILLFLQRKTIIQCSIIFTQKNSEKNLAIKGKSSMRISMTFIATLLPIFLLPL